MDRTLESFIGDRSNRLARAAMVTVMEAPAQEYNPLFIYGPNGVGKTHLLYGYQSYQDAARPDRRVVYTTFEELGSMMVERIRAETYSRADLAQTDLLIDDFHPAARMPELCKELTECLDLTIDGGHQVIIASDRPPRSYPTLEPWLRERRGWSLITDLEEPTLGLRLLLLSRRHSKSANRQMRRARA